MSYRHEWENNGVLIKFWGATSGSEIDEAIDQIRNSPDLSKLGYVISDYLVVDEFRVTRYDVLLIAARDHWVSVTNANLKIALVGGRSDVLNALKCYAASSVIKDTFEVCIFTDLVEARNWASSQ